MKHGPHTITVTPRANCRRMILRYRPDAADFALSVPLGTTAAAIRAFLADNQAWLDRQASGKPWTPSFAPGEQHCHFGQWVKLGHDAPAGDAFCRWQADQIAAVLKRLLETWAPAMRVRITHVTLQDMSSRWGSCRPKTGRLTFNTRLAHYPERIIEETVVHELCHFAHADHSAAFYAEMDRWLPDWRARKAEREGADVKPRPPHA